MNLVHSALLRGSTASPTPSPCNSSYVSRSMPRKAARGGTRVCCGHARRRRAPSESGAHCAAAGGDQGQIPRRLGRQRAYAGSSSSPRTSLSRRGCLPCSKGPARLRHRASKIPIPHLSVRHTSLSDPPLSTISDLELAFAFPGDLARSWRYL